MSRRTTWIAGAIAVLLSAGLFGGATGHPVRPAAVASGETPQRLRSEVLTVHTRHGAAKFMVMIADNDHTREIGLMFRKSMRPEEGMIFDFHDAQDVSFWMRNTILPLDIIFISASGQILNIAANAKPFDETPLPSEGPVRAVLEINAGLAAKLDIRPGDQISDKSVYPASRHR